MANTFVTTQEIARKVLPLLRSNLVFPALSFNDYSDEYAKKGDTIQVRKPPIYKANEFSDTITVQDTKEESVLVTLDKIADVSVSLTAKEMALSLEDFTKQVLEPAAAALAEKINADGLALYKDIPYVCGEAGVTPSQLGNFSEAAKILNDNKAPVSGRSAVWNSSALAAFQTLPAVVNAEKCGSNQALREGSIGRVIGLDNYMSQQVWDHIAGNIASTTTIVPSAAVAAGAKSMTLKASGSGTLSGKIAKGDIFTVGGKTYTVTADAEVKSNAVTVEFYPAAPEGGMAATDVITFTGSHAANLAFHKNAFGFVTRPLEKAVGAESYVTSFDGITLRVTVDYNIANKTQTMSIDTLYGFKTLYPELAVRVLG